MRPNKETGFPGENDKVFTVYFKGFNPSFGLCRLFLLSDPSDPLSGSRGGKEILHHRGQKPAGNIQGSFCPARGKDRERGGAFRYSE
jgi:hypothetical protein